MLSLEVLSLLELELSLDLLELSLLELVVIASVELELLELDDILVVDCSVELDSELVVDGVIDELELSDWLEVVCCSVDSELSEDSLLLELEV